jgi:hypothetical protein
MNKSTITIQYHDPDGKLMDETRFYFEFWDNVWGSETVELLSTIASAMIVKKRQDIEDEFDD